MNKSQRWRRDIFVVQVRLLSSSQYKTRKGLVSCIWLLWLFSLHLCDYVLKVTMCWKSSVEEEPKDYQPTRFLEEYLSVKHIHVHAVYTLCYYSYSLYILYRNYIYMPRSKFLFTNYSIYKWWIVASLDLPSPMSHRNIRELKLVPQFSLGLLARSANGFWAELWYFNLDYRQKAGVTAISWLVLPWACNSVYLFRAVVPKLFLLVARWLMVNPSRGPQL